MRIKKARVQNFKSIIDSGEINLDDRLTAIIGRNEQGKTNFLKSLTTINKSYSYSNDDLCYKISSYEQAQEEPIVTLWFALNEEDKEYFKSLSIKIPEYDTIRVSKFFNNIYDISFSNSLLNDVTKLTDDIWLKNKEEIYLDLKNFFKRNLKLMGRENEENHLRYIISLERKEGGFSNSINQPPTLEATYHAIETLKEFNSLDRIDRSIEIKYILSNESKNTIGFVEAKNQIVTLQSTFYAVMSLKNLHKLDELDKDKYINFILSLQNKDGGFAHKMEDSTINSTLENTFYAVRILKSLNGIPDQAKERIIEFILSVENTNGGFSPQHGDEANIPSTYYATAILAELDEIGKIDWGKHADFIKSKKKNNGGFGNKSDNIDEMNAFFSIKVLDNLFGVDGPIIDSATQFILSAQMKSGGFSYRGKTQRLDSIFYSISIIKLFELMIEVDVSIKIKHIICDEDRYLSDIIKAIEDYFDALKSKYIIEGDLGNLLEKYFWEGDNKQSIKSMILERLPNLLYSDDRMDLLKDNLKIYEFNNNKDKYKTVTNLFMLSGTNIEELGKKKGFDRRRDTDAASLRVTNLLKDSWSQAKIKVNIWIDGDEIHFSIEDESGISVPPTKRSDGFQWYLSFYINFMAGIKGDLRNSILLLDNPGLQLHPSGQKDLLSTLEELSMANQIIYTTHSPYLIEVEHLDQVRIIEKDKDKGSIIKEKYYQSTLDAIRPIRDALGFSLRDSLFISEENIIVEGPSDKYILEGILTYLKDSVKLDLSKLFINSPGGANKIPYYALFMASESLKFVVVLDNDSAGKKAAKELERISQIDTKQIIKLDQVITEDNATLEDLINPLFYNLAVNSCYRDILKEKLGMEEIPIGEISDNGRRIIGQYSKFFHDKGLGSFDKVLVSIEIKKILEEKKPEQSVLGTDTLRNFERIFALINEGFNA